MVLFIGVTFRGEVLNQEQRIVLDLVLPGHNVFFCGTGGTGKTFTVKKLANILKVTKTVAITCTTGMACRLYNNEAMTLHSFAGLINARMSVEALIESICSRESCLQRWKTTDVLIIDEVSQLSRKTFETIIHIAQAVRGGAKPFGGMQVITVGDFKQLPPVSNDLDKGDYCFESPLWKLMFSHNIQLSVVYRQEQKDFIDVLNEVAVGEMSENGVCFMNKLSSKALIENDFGLHFIPHIFCTNFDANYHNMEQLMKLPGAIKQYHAIDTADVETLNKVTLAESCLTLKIGAPVMLLYNLSSKLINGTRGTIEALEDDGPTVNFEDVGLTMKLQRCTWFAYKVGTADDIIGQRSQFPLRLAWGITAHKVQGQTMKAAVVHSGNEFVPGQLYVACSRVSTKEGLKIVGFNQKKLIKQDHRVTNFYANLSSSTPVVDLTCCREINATIDNSCGINIQIGEDVLFDTMSESELLYIEDLCNQMFTEDDEGAVNSEGISVETILETMRVDGILQSNQLPGDLDLKEFLEELKDKSDVKIQAEHNSLREKMNCLLTDLQNTHLDGIHGFLQIYWARISNNFSKRIKNVQGKKRYDFKAILSDEMIMLNSPDISREFSAVINDMELCTHHFCIMTEIIKKLRTMYIYKLYAETVKSSNTEVPNRECRSVWNMHDNCLGKVRYIGGWVLAKLINADRKYITSNALSSSINVRSKLHQRYRSVNLLESLLVPSSVVHSTSQYTKSLEATDLKQYRENSLLYVNDDTFKFFMNLEQSRIDLLCDSKLNILKSDMIAIATTTVKQNTSLMDQWVKLFEDELEKELLVCLFHEVIEKYFRMGCGQYLRDFRRDHNIQKTEAHRKKVVERKMVKDRKDDKVTITQMSMDTSVNKEDSHHLLVSMITKHPIIFNSTVYNKEEIKHIFAAYGLKYCASWNKSKLNDILVNHLKSANRMTDPTYLNGLQ